ncbi:DUF5316 domain-containing protein [Lysinibacillus sp. 54212]|uniref:DUF5316 domain-containing protein n=1 Tax=Lysinibacillus sp. 54212 TaxID=3119829 RepID=UPI002FCACA05
MKYLLIGALLSLIGIIVSLVFWDIGMVYQILGAIALLFIVVAMIFSGSLVSGDRMRANVAIESDTNREYRNKVFTSSFLIAMPNLILALLFYFL